MDKIASWKNVHVDDWTTERAIFASNITEHVICISYLIQYKNGKMGSEQ